MSKKKLLKLGLTIAPFSIAPVALVASCGNGSSNPNNPNNPSNGQSYLAEITSIPQAEITKFKDDHKDIAKISRAILVTDEGIVTDKSFNQSAWEAVQKISNDLGIPLSNKTANKDNSFIQPPKGKLEQGYRTAIDLGYQYIVLNGYTHGDPLTNFLKTNPNYLKKVKDNKIVFICVDFDLSDYIGSGTLASDMKGHHIPLLFATDQAAFMAGYALADYFATVYPTEKNNRTFGAFGGIPYAAVTDFIVGALKGIKYFNMSNAGKETHTISSTIKLDTGFDTGSASASATVNSVSTAQAIFPVAGSFTQLVVAKEQQLNKAGQVILGVDTDQSKAFPNSGRFFTSVTKLVGQAVYSTLAGLYLTNGDTVDLFPGFKLGVSNATPKKLGYSKNKADKFVDVAKAALSDSGMNTKAQASLDKAIKVYEDNNAVVMAELQNNYGQPAVAGNWSNLVNYLANELNK